MDKPARVQRCVSLEDVIPRKAANFWEIKRRPVRFVHIPGYCPRKSHKQTELPRWTNTGGDQQLPIEKVSFEFAILVFETSHVLKNQFQERTHSRSVVQFRNGRIEFSDQLANEILFTMKFSFVREGTMFSSTTSVPFETIKRLLAQFRWFSSKTIERETTYYCQWNRGRNRLK